MGLQNERPPAAPCRCGHMLRAGAFPPVPLAAGIAYLLPQDDCNRSASNDAGIKLRSSPCRCHGSKTPSRLPRSGHTISTSVAQASQAFATSSTIATLDSAMIDPACRSRNRSSNSSWSPSAIPTPPRSSNGCGAEPPPSSGDLISLLGAARKTVNAPAATTLTADRTPKSSCAAALPDGSACTDSPEPASSPCIACNVQAHG
jgi:hypothetical protein